jgi:DNA-binding FadR family transcriptional regulator
VRATDAELADLREAHRALAELSGDAEAFMRADLEFGRRIVRCAHNLALELLFNTIARVIDGNPAFRPVRDVQPDVTIQTYGALLALLEARDAEVVRAATRAELQRLDEVTLDKAGRAAQPTPAPRISTFDFRGSAPPGPVRKEA